jgi:hypothetical protein
LLILAHLYCIADHPGATRFQEMLARFGLADLKDEMAAAKKAKKRVRRERLEPADGAREPVRRSSRTASKVRYAESSHSEEERAKRKDDSSVELSSAPEDDSQVRAK